MGCIFQDTFYNWKSNGNLEITLKILVLIYLIFSVANTGKLKPGGVVVRMVRQNQLLYNVYS